jgi:hypothetical protein
MMADRRFPPPWIVEEHAEGFIIRDAKRPSAVPTMPPASRSAR